MSRPKKKPVVKHRFRRTMGQSRNCKTMALRGKTLLRAARMVLGLAPAMVAVAVAVPTELVWPRELGLALRRGCLGFSPRLTHDLPGRIDGVEQI